MKSALLFLITSLSPISRVGQERLGVLASVSHEIPKAAIVEIILLSAPGIDHEESRWKIAYELSIANVATLWKGGKQGKFKGGIRERIGELIKEGVAKRGLRSPENRKLVFKIPLSTEVQERLRNHPRDAIKLTPGKITPEDVKLSREQELKSQAFLFRSVIEVYDARLKKTLLIPASFTWSFGSYPQARFEIKVEINNDGSYSVNRSFPAKTRSH